MKLAMRATILAAVTSISSVASAASASGSLSFDWAALTITSLFGGTVTTSNNSAQFTGEAYSAGPLSDNKAGVNPIQVDIGTATGTANAGSLSLASTSGSVALAAQMNKTIDLTGLALYQVTLPYSYSFAAIASPGGGSAGMNGELQLTSTASYANGSYQTNLTSLFANYGPFDVQSGGIESRSGHGLLTLLVGTTPTTTAINISAFAMLNGGAYGPMAPVPEPGSYAMLLAGLGLVGTITLRRKGMQT